MAIYFLGVPTLSFVVCTEGDKFNSFLCQKRHNAQEKKREQDEVQRQENMTDQEKEKTTR